jgi:DNA replication protein DnaC
MMIGDGEKRLNECWRYFNPPKRLADARFENFTPKTKQQQEALPSCRGYNLEKIRQGVGLFLFGAYGAGKSHLTVATVHSLMSGEPEAFGVRARDSQIFSADHEDYRGITCSFFSVVDLLDAMRPGNESKQALGEWAFHRAKADDLVVLDDIGAERVTEWVEERLYAIIDVRYRMERATILTSNLREKELEKQLGGRIVSRIFEMTEQVPVIGPDHRRKGA